MKLLLIQNTHNNIISGNSLENNIYSNFDVIFTNPPFGAKINRQSLLKNFQLGYKWNKTSQGFIKNNSVLSGQSVETLFIEKCLGFLKTGGRMAIVLPNGNFENSSLEYVRSFIMKKAKILAVVNLPQETFIPFGTGVKTSLLFLQKKDETDTKEYPIFFGKITKLGYQGNKNGTPIYKKDAYGQFIFNENKSKILDEDITGIALAYHDYKNGKNFVSVKSFAAQSSQITNRLDFDFYSPETRNLIINTENKTVRLGDICEIVKTKSSKLKMSNISVRYIELSDINACSFEVINAAMYNTHDLPSRASYEVKEGDIITAVAGNSVGTKKHATALVSKKYSGCICTNGFRILRNIKISPYYLLYYMRTEKFLKQMFMYRTGAAIPSVSDNDINNILIEIPADDIIRSIDEKMRNVFLLRNKAQEEFESIFQQHEQ